MGCAGTGIRNGVAKQTEMGGVEDVKVRRSKCFSDRGELSAAIRVLKAQHEGEIEVAGPELAHSLTELGLIDEYRLYLHPVVLGQGKPFFAGPRTPLSLVASDRIGEQVIRLTYVPV
jgi:riboflavin biosynthesis pyrimidine reductase